ncbi:MAG TPA: von Willebrand factor type A domain-containing protein [Thermoanaerobaculia bacterium]|jgi:hypothetical protein|nr:von Willebrand factor type A domain-containing protein [Thermoanaerobaculia bacterium]
MSPLTDRQLAQKLRSYSAPEPPPGLLDELRRQIPAEVKAPAPPEHPDRLGNLGRLIPFQRPMPRRVWLAAASIVTLVGGGTLSWLALRHDVAEEAVAEPSHAVARDSDRESPAETRAGSAEATQPRDRTALGYAGAPSAAPPASAPAYPGLARQRQAAAPPTESGEAQRLRVPSAPPQLAEGLMQPPPPPRPVPSGRVEPRADTEDEVTVTAESPLADERRISTGATVSREELAKIPTLERAPSPAAQAGGGIAANAPTAAKAVAAPALDLGTRSYDVVRRYLGDGRLPPAEAVRVEELVNAFDYGDAAPSQDDFALTAEAAPDPWAPGDRYLLARFTVTARDVPDEAPTGALSMAAQDARAQIEFDPRVVARWRLLGKASRDAAGQRTDSLDAGELGPGHAVTALYELELRPDAPPDATLAVVRLRWRPAGGRDFHEIRQPLRRSAVADSWENANRGFRLATVVGHFAEVLRGSNAAQQSEHGDDLAELARRAAQVSEDWPRQQRVAELVSWIERARDARRAP